jgi:hypothetical protein
VNWLTRLFARRMRGTSAAIASPAAQTTPAKFEPEQPSRVVVKRLILPQGVEAQIIEALQRGEEPDKKWTRKGRRRVYGSFFHKVVGESFDNPNGVSRQSILATAQVGTAVYFIPEPSNPVDREAVGIYLGTGDGGAVQIGYLPSSSKLKPYVATGAIAAWLARVRRRDEMYGAVVYAAVKWPE